MLKYLAVLLAASASFLGASPFLGAKEASTDQDFQFSVTLMEQEEFAASVELWSPRFVPSGYFRFARFGALFGTHNYYQVTSSDHKRHVSSYDGALGYQIGMQTGPVQLRSAFLLGYSKVDRTVAAGPDGPGGDPDPHRFGYFETRHGFEVVPPTHMASAQAGMTSTNEISAPQRSIFELGIGFRWNFIGSDKLIKAGDVTVREMQVFPYLAAHVFI